jgi:hypothetical protein
MKTNGQIVYGPILGKQIQVDQEFIWIQPDGDPPRESFISILWSGETSIPYAGWDYLLRCSFDKLRVVLPRDKFLGCL